MREGLIALRERDYAGSAARLEELRRRGVDSFEVRYYLARALTGLRRHREAATHFAAAAERLPGYAAAHLGLADARIATGDLRGAQEALQRGRQASPRDPRLPEREAQVWRKLKRPVEAVAAYEAAIALAPKDALLRVQLGESLRDAGAARRRGGQPARGGGPRPGGRVLLERAGHGAGRPRRTSQRRKRPSARRWRATPPTRPTSTTSASRSSGGASGRTRREAFRRTLALDPRFAAARARLAEAGG